MRRVRMWLWATTTCALASAAAESPYKAGWTAANFYAAVEQCRYNFYLPGVGHYAAEQVAAAQARGEDPDTLTPRIRHSVIRGARVIDEQWTALCFCMVEQTARKVAHAELTPALLWQAVEAPACAAAKAAGEAPRTAAQIEEGTLQ